MSSKQLSSILDRAIPTTKKTTPSEVTPDPVTQEELPKSAEVVTIKKAEKPKKEKAPTTPEPQKAIQAYVPASVARAINIRAAEEGVTVRTIILQGLKAVGVSVPEEELRDRRK